MINKINFTHGTLPRIKSEKRGRPAIAWGEVISLLAGSPEGTEVRIRYGSHDSAMSRASQLRNDLNARKFRNVKEVHVTSLRSDVVLSIVPERRGRKRHAA